MDKVAVNGFLNQDFHYTEAFKTLRTNLMFSGTEIQAVGVTSFQAAEGKSTVSLYLAASLAQNGKKVLLMDADLRKSQLASRLRIRGRLTGLSHLLSGLANANEVLWKTDIDGMYILFAGARVPNSAELLGGKNFAQLMKALKESFDYIIVDCAPVGLVIDCATMAPALDGVLMVIDTTNNSAKLERRVRDQLQRVGAKILGTVLTKVDTKDKNGYYGKVYGYGYGYGEK